MLEFVSNPENLWAVTKELLAAVVSHVRAPRCVRRACRGDMLLPSLVDFESPYLAFLLLNATNNAWGRRDT